MTRTTRLISTLALLALAAPGWAQDTATDAVTEDAATEEAATTATDAAETDATETDAADANTPLSSPNDLAMGIPTQAADGPGTPYAREEFGDWTLRCVRVEEGQEPCLLYQLLLDQDGNAVAEIGMFLLPDGSEAVAGANFVAPMETFLPAGMRLSVDGGETLTYPFTFCSGRPFSPLLSSGCLARIGFNDQMVSLFKRGNAAQITIVPALAPDQEVVLDLSLSGFTAGYDAQN